MIKEKINIYLASKSPRRKKLLALLNLKIRVIKCNYREDHLEIKQPARLVKELALHKLEAVSHHNPKGIIITADTIVVYGKKILNKPLNKKDALRMLSFLSGKTHTVYTGFCVYNSITGKMVNSYEKTGVKFRSLNRKEILDYIETGSPMDKAGAYGIQDDYGAVFISRINGCYYNVVGLPLTKVHQAILKVL